MKATVCLIVKNEEDCIVEWLLHYHHIGFDQVIVYDNGSSDRTAALVNDCAAKIDCRCINWTPKSSLDPQVDAYNDCVQRFGSSTDWLAFYDIDEFLISADGLLNFKDLLERFYYASSIGLNWVMFGSNFKEDKGEELVMEAFTARAPMLFPANRNIKSIIKPAMVKGLCNNPHWVPVYGDSINILGNPIRWSYHLDGSAFEGVVAQEDIVQGGWRVHHYYTRGAAKWRARLARGQCGGLIVTEDHRTPLDRSDEKDTSSLLYAAAVRRLAAEYGLPL